MVGESRDVFTKPVLGENTLALSCMEILGGCPSFALSADAHDCMGSKLLLSYKVFNKE